MAKLGFKFKFKNKNREAVPNNVEIVKPSIDEQTLYKLLLGSHIVMSRKRGKVAVNKSYCYVSLYQV